MRRRLLWAPELLPDKGEGDLHCHLRGGGDPEPWKEVTISPGPQSASRDASSSADWTGTGLRQVPSRKRHHRLAHAEPERDFGERPRSPRNRDEDICGPRHDCVARKPEPCCNRNGNPAVRIIPVVPGEYANGRPTGGTRAPAGRLHHATPSTADEKRAAPGDEPAHLLCQYRLFRGAGGTADDANYDSISHDPAWNGAL